MHQHPQSINYELFLVVENHILKLCVLLFYSNKYKHERFDKYICVNNLCSVLIYASTDINYSPRFIVLSVLSVFYIHIYTRRRI